MVIKVKVLFCIIIVAVSVAAASADEVYFKDDRVVRGKIVRVDSDHVTVIPDNKRLLEGKSGKRYSVNDDGNSIDINREGIRRLVYDDSKNVNLSDGDETKTDERDGYKFDNENNSNDASGPDYIFSISAGIDKMSGNTTYQIGGKVDTPEGSGYQRFPTSELEFPLNVYMYTIEGNAKLFENWKIDCNYSWNIGKDAGKMKDSDWGIWYYDLDGWPDPDSLDIYSKTDAELKARITDANISYMFLRIRSSNLISFLYVGAGYLYQTFDFKVRNLDQWYPSMNDYAGYDIGHDRVSGLVGTYKVTTKIPYFALSLEMNYREILYIDMSLGYSPFVKVNDEDHHLLREPPIVSKAKCEGDAKLFSIGVRCFMPRIVFVKIKYEFSSVNTDGREKAWEGGVYSYTIDQKSFSKRMNYGIAIGGEEQF
jgi:hypothetical protein